MRTFPSYFSGLILSASLLGCGGGGGTTTADMTVADDKTLGAQYVKQRACAGCHDPGDNSLSGQDKPQSGTMAYGANLTPDKATGIGDWTDDDIKNALKKGVDDEGAKLCPTMPAYPDMSDAEVRAITAYLRSLKAVNHAVPESTCPPIKPASTDGGAPVDMATKG